MSTPLPFEEDPQEGEVDDGDVVGEPKLGCQLRTVLPPFRRYMISHYWALNKNGTHPPLHKGSVE